MLEELVVDGLGVIDHAEAVFDPGSNVITGETGAGKTLVVAAVGLLLGDRADRVLVREGRDDARVEGRFVLPGFHRAVAALRARGLVEEDTDGDEVEVVVARTLRRGSSSARINGHLVPVGVLAEVAAHLAEIAGQHDHTRAIGQTWQRKTLDAYAGPEALALADTVAAEWRDAVAARRRLEEIDAGQKARERELDVVSYEIKEIEGAQIEPGESDRLAADARRLEQAEALGSGITSAVESLRGERGAEEAIAAARSTIGPLVDADPVLGELDARLASAETEVADVALELKTRVTEPDPEALAATRERLAVLARLKRKYGDSEAEVLAYLENARERREGLAATGEDATRLEADARRHHDAAAAAARELSRARASAAKRLKREMEALLDQLALGGARFEAKLEERDLYEGGSETVEFLVAANAGETPRPVSKVASGGELSRISLALRLLTAPDDAPVLIFDEVDAGVGGQAAQAVGSALARLARETGAQVLVVTHLPQVAAFADAQLRVTKSDRDGRSSAAIERVDGSERVAELSRMLAGLPGSERAREHAQELLELARAQAVA